VTCVRCGGQVHSYGYSSFDLSDNAINQNYVFVVLLKMTFGFRKVKWLQLTGEVGKFIRF